MPRMGTWVALLAVALLIGGLSWALLRQPAAGKVATVHAGPDALGRDSQRLLPEELAPAYLGMAMKEFAAARPAARRLPKADEELFFAYDEGLPPGRRVIYSIAKADLRLAKVQIMSELPNVEQIAPRIAQNQQRYGAPSGVWDCPQGVDQLPTRRFSWTRGQVGVLDIYLIVGERVATTLYVAPAGVVRESLARARCVPTPRENFATFPVPPPSRSPSEK